MLRICQRKACPLISSHVGFFRNTLLTTQHLNSISARNISHEKEVSSPSGKKISQDKAKLSPVQLQEKAIKESKRYWRYSYKPKEKHRLEKWNALGPPPISEYRLTFGKHRGKRLDEVPDSYLVRYLIPRRNEKLRADCPIIYDALEDFMKMHPDVKGQGGRGKAKPLKEGIMNPAPPTKRRKAPPV